MAGVLHQPLHLRADRAELGDREIGQRRLELGELLAGELGDHGVLLLVGEGGVDAQQVVGVRPLLGIFQRVGHRQRIGLGATDLLGDRVGIVGEVDARVIRRIGLAHLLGAVTQAHHARCRAKNQRLGDREEVGLAEIVVELDGDVARQLEMLLLVLADRHVRGLVDQDVGRHQRRIGEQAQRDVLAVLAGLLLELRHAAHPAHARHAIEDPGELRVLGHHRLVEHDLLGAVDAGREEGRGDLAGLRGEHLGILRHGDRVLVDHAVEALVVVLQAREVADRAEIVAEMEIAGGLHARKDPALEAARFVSGEMRVGCAGRGGDRVRHGCGLRCRSMARGLDLRAPRRWKVRGGRVSRRSPHESRRSG